MAATAPATTPVPYRLTLTRQSRYHNIVIALDTILRHGATALRFLEIGTGTGALAVEILNYWRSRAAAYKVSYYGFDEFSETAKSTASKVRISEVLKRLGSDVTVKLNDGYPPRMLPQACRGVAAMHLVVMGGSRNPDTIEETWDALQPVITPTTIVLLDNYYVNDCHHGCKPLADVLTRARRPDGSRAHRVALLCPLEQVTDDAPQTRMVRVYKVPEPDVQEAECDLCSS